MMSPASPLHRELEQKVQVSTGRRIRDLDIELRPEQVILRGRAVSYHVKQLAQHSVRELLPDVRLENAIIVDNRN